jgi:hypothetical protein
VLQHEGNDDERPHLAVQLATIDLGMDEQLAAPRGRRPTRGREEVLGVDLSGAAPGQERAGFIGERSCGRAQQRPQVRRCLSGRLSRQPPAQGGGRQGGGVQRVVHCPLKWRRERTLCAQPPDEQDHRNSDQQHRSNAEGAGGIQLGGHRHSVSLRGQS